MTDIATNWTDSIGMTVNASYLNGLGTAVNANTHAQTLVDTYANLPAAAAGNTGAVFFCTDNDAIYKSDGSAWTKIRVAGIANANLTDPPSSSWSTTTLGSTTFAASLDGRLCTCPSAAGDNHRVEYRALSPTSNYTCQAVFTFGAIAASNVLDGGLYLRESSSSKLISFGYSYASGWNLYVTKWTNATTFSAHYTNIAMGAAATGNQVTGYPPMLRIRDDNTNRYYEYSFNGIDWNAVTSNGRTDFLTADRIGWGMLNSSGTTASLRLRSFKVY